MYKQCPHRRVLLQGLCSSSALSAQLQKPQTHSQQAGNLPHAQTYDWPCHYIILTHSDPHLLAGNLSQSPTGAPVLDNLILDAALQQQHRAALLNELK